MIDALRGSAILGVCLWHFTNSAGLSDGFVKWLGAFGWLGVEIFFVISGFIIPYALHHSSYQIADYGRFIIKRMVRLDPPYLVGLLIVIVLGYIAAATPGFRGPPFQPSFTQVVLHLGYVNFLFGYPWLNEVFWTLAIELQYYLLVGLAFPAIAHRSIYVRGVFFSLMACLALFIPGGQFLFHWMFLFMLGMATFQFRANIIGHWEFLSWTALLGLGAWHVGGLSIAAAGVATTLLLGLCQSSFRPPFLFLGKISYSLYLLHIPIGTRIINLSQRYVHSTAGKLATLAMAFAMSIAAAWLLYRYVERPAQQWSSGIRYRRKRIHASELSAQPQATE